MPAPDAIDDVASLDEDGTVVIDVLANDADADSILSHTQPLNGGLVLLPNDTFGYVPIRNYSGQDSFTYTVDDGNGVTDTATVFITVNPVNDSPVAGDDQFSVDEDASATILFVLNNDYDAEDETVTITEHTQPTSGSVTNNGNGSFDYTPSGGFSGQDSFTYTISDSDGNTDTATVALTVVATGTRPIPRDDEAVTGFGTPVLIQVLENDTPGIDGLRIDFAFIRGNGTIEISPDETAILYTPDAGFFGFDTFTYRVSDDFAVPAARVQVHVQPPAPDPDRGLIESFDESEGFVIRGEENSDRLGESVARAGDINGDGIDDLIVAAPSADLYGQASGTAYVIYGTEQGFGHLEAGRRVLELDQIDATIGFRIHRNAFDLIGSSVAAAGDVNGDGLDDIIVATENGGPGGNTFGESWVLFGRTDGFGAIVDLDLLSPDEGFFIAGAQPGGTGNDSNGGSDSRDAIIGDVNGDGIDDFIVASPGQLFQGGEDSAGRVYVIFGTRDGFGEVINNRRIFELESLPPDQGFVLRGASDGAFSGFDRAGWSVAGAGDVNADGFDDFIVGTRNDTAYLVFGSDQGFAAEIQLRSIDQQTGVVLRGANQSDAGHSVTGLGDVNGDGIADLAIGARNATLGGSQVGATYVIFGRTTGFGVEEASQRILDLDILSAEDGFIIRGDSRYDDAGFVVASAGDFNGDGFGDIIVGAPYGDDGAHDAGEAYIIYGTDQGFGIVVGEQRIDLTGLPPEKGIAIQGDSEERALGFGVAFAGDVNNDGFDDVIIGGPGRDFGRLRNDGPGEAYVLFGFGDPVENLAPVAVDDLATVPANQFSGLATSSLLADDSDPDGDPLTVIAAGPAAHGTTNLASDDVLFYTPDPGYSGPDSFTYTISDGRGGTATATVFVTVLPPNQQPVANDDALFASIDTARSYAATVLLANDSDADSDVLSITAVQDAVNGTVALDGSVVTFTPDAGFTGAASFTYTVSDGNGGSDTASVGVTVTEGNQPPFAPATQPATTLRGAAILVEVGASDPDDDVLSYEVAGAANGTAGIDEDGLVTYTPNAGFTGSETLVVTIDDGNGGIASQEIALTVSVLPAANQFRLFAADGFAGAIGGSGAVIGTGGFQDIAVLDVAGTVSFDPSFNAGNDIVRLSGDADDWYVGKSGSSAIFTDGDTFVQLAVGPAGMAVVFDDGARTLRLDTGSGGTFLIGDQVFTATLARVDAAPDGTVLPTGAQAEASARLFLAEDGGASAAGKVNVIGTGGAEIATLLSGTITLDPSFNKGGDVIRVDEAAEDFLASKSGSSALLVGSDTTLLVPVGLAGATLAFGDGSDTRELLLSIEPNGITIDEQFFGVDPMRLMAAV